MGQNTGRRENNLLRDWARRLVAVILSIRCFGGAAPPTFVVFIPWRRGTEARTANRGRAHRPGRATGSRGASTSPSLSDISDWRDGVLYPFAKGRRRLGRGASRPAD